MILLVVNDGPLAPEWLDHALKGDWIGHRECRVGGDFLLIFNCSRRARLTPVRVSGGSKFRSAGGRQLS
jgi:mRNA interferase YafQ